MSSERVGTRELRGDDGSPDPYAIVEEFFPYDGPHGMRVTDAAATAIARLVRYLNNATQPGYPGIPNAPTLGRVIGDVGAALYGLDQLLDQLGYAAHQFADDPTLYDDRRPGEQGRETALELAAALRELRHGVKLARRPLDRAAGLGSRLGHRAAGAP